MQHVTTLSTGQEDTDLTLVQASQEVLATKATRRLEQYPLD